MKKKIIIACLLIGAAFNAFAQKMDLEPGLYVVNGPQYIPMIHQRGRSSNWDVVGVEFAHYKYKGAEAPIVSTGEFLLVIDTEKKAATITPRKCNIFVKWFTPKHLRFVRLEQKKKARVLYRHEFQSFLETMEYLKGNTNFEWEQIADNAYLIHYQGDPGEYAIVGLTFDKYDPAIIWGFTIK